MIPESKLQIQIIHQTEAAAVGWRTAANFPHQTIFRREETCGIVAAALIAGGCKTKRSEKSSNGAKYLKKNIQTANSICSLDSVHRQWSGVLPSELSDQI
ncbi:MAG: hypothetical protein KJO34_05005 [Deltaproteobacteria bacterium]|nr:hypothetical protein [Deltaproteobacteria bacterium]